MKTVLTWPCIENRPCIDAIRSLYIKAGLGGEDNSLRKNPHESYYRSPIISNQLCKLSLWEETGVL